MGAGPWSGPGASASTLSVGPCLGPSGVQGRVPGCLWARATLRKPACWWWKLCPCQASCLAWGIPTPAPTGWWAGLGPSANKLEGESQTDACQHQCPHGKTGSQNCSASVSVPRVSSSCLLPLWETLQDQQVDLTQAPFKWLLLPWVLECVIFVCAL